MTPKEKAIELVDKFNKPDTTHYPYVHNAQQCALIAVDEIIEVTAPCCDRYEPYYLELKAEMTQQYWQDVKQEIEAL